MEVVVCRTSKIKIVFIATMAIPICENIHGQNLCEQANTAQQNGSRGFLDFEKWTLYLLLLYLFMVPNMFMPNTSVNKQMQAQQSGSCGVANPGLI